MAKLILTNEVAGLGSAGDVVEVKNGFARNYLIPQGFAVAWSRGGEKQVASIRAARDARAIHDHEEAVALKNALESNKVKLAVKAAGLGELDKRKIHITSPIKSVGEHEATIRLRDDLTAVITLQVVAAK